MGAGIRALDPPEKTKRENWFPTKVKLFTVIFHTIVVHIPGVCHDLAPSQGDSTHITKQLSVWTITPSCCHVGYE